MFPSNSPFLPYYKGLILGGGVVDPPPWKSGPETKKVPVYALSYHASVISNILNLRKSWFYTIRLQNKGIKKFEFVGKKISFFD